MVSGCSSAAWPTSACLTFLRKKSPSRPVCYKQTLLAGFVFRLRDDAKPEVFEFEWRGNSVTGAGPAFSGEAVPRAAANYFNEVVPILLPASSVIRRLKIVIVPGIKTPFPDVAVHVIKSERVRHSQAANRRRLLARGAFRSRGVRRLGVVV